MGYRQIDTRQCRESMAAPMTDEYQIVAWDDGHRPGSTAVETKVITIWKYLFFVALISLVDGIEYE